MLCVRDLVPADAISRPATPFTAEMRNGERVCVIGRGAAKLLTCIAGVSPAAGGAIELTLPAGPVRIDGLSLESRAAHGIVYVPATRNIFAALTVLENLNVAFTAHRIPRTAEGPLIDDALGLAPTLCGRLNQLAGTLSGGEQRALSIARAALVIQAHLHAKRGGAHFPLLLLNEPTRGLDPTAVERLAHQIRRLSDTGIALMMADQSAKFVECVAGKVIDQDAHGPHSSAGKSADVRSVAGPE